MSRLHYFRERRLRQLVFGHVSAREARRLAEHMSKCSTCGSYYDELVQVEAALHKEQDGPLTRGQVERIAQRLGLGGKPAVATSKEKSNRTPFLFGWAPSLAAATAAVLAVVGVLVGPGNEGSDGLQSRGLLKEGGRTSRVDVYCISPSEGEPSLRPMKSNTTLPFLTRRNRCSTSSHFAFAFVPGQAPPPYVFVLGIDEALTPKWYYPQPQEYQSLRTSGLSRDGMLPGAVALRSNHRAGRLQVLTLYSKEPIRVDHVALQLAEQQRTGRKLEGVRFNLPGLVAVQSVEVDLEDAHD